MRGRKTVTGEDTAIMKGGLLYSMHIWKHLSLSETNLNRSSI